MEEETESDLLIRVDAAWRAARDDPRRARQLADAVIAECRPVDVDAHVAALRVRGWVERVIFSHTDALATLDEGVRLARRHRLSGRLAQVLTARASVWLEIGSFARARRDRLAARRALGGAESLELDAHEAVYEIKLGHHARAADLCRQTLDRLGMQDDPVLRFQLLTNLGTCLLSLGDADGAERAYGDGARVAATVGRLALGFVTQGLGMSAVRRGDLPEALRRFDRSEELLRETGWPLGEHYLDRIEGFMTLRLLDEAQDATDRAIRYFAGPGGAMLLAETLLRQARLLLWRGEAAEAAAVAVTATELLRRQRRSAYRAQAELLAAEARLASGAVRDGELRAALAAARRLDRAGFTSEGVDGQLVVAQLARLAGAEGVARRSLATVAERCRSGSTLLRIKGTLAEASIAELSGDGSAMRAAARRGIRHLERFRATLPTTELRALAAAHGVELTTLGLRSVMSSGRAGDALIWMELGRVASARYAPSPSDDAEVLGTSARLREVISAQRFGGGADPDELTRLGHEQVRLERRIQRRLRTIDPRRVAPDRIASPAAIRRGLGDGTLVEITELDGRLVAVVLGRTTSALRDLGPSDEPRRELGALLFGLRRLVRTRPGRTLDAVSAGIRHSIDRLDACLMRPLHDEIADAHAVLIAPPAALFAAPWHALPSLAGSRVTVTPSATVWLRAAQPRTAGNGVVLAAGPDLAGAEHEIRKLASLWPAHRSLVPPDATVQRVLQAMDGAQLTHLACHGTFRADNPSFSSLQLSDGPLTVLDLERLGRAPDLVVFAACDSGVSEALPGDELLGLLAALVALGARAVVASVAPVPDVESTPLMVALHERLARGLPVDQALTEARTALDPSTPAGLVATLAYGCFGSGAVTVGTGS